jgi:hypothetical protein
VRRQWYEDGTGWYNYEIAADRYGTQFAIPTAGGTFVYNDAYQKIGTLGLYANDQPIAAAYHPVEEIAYFPWTPTNEIRAYDMTTLTQIGSYDFGIPFGPVYNWAFVQGRTRLSRDGSLLMVTTDGGVGLQQLYASLQAAEVPVATGIDQSVDIALQGSIGNGGALSYVVAQPPTHGTVTLNGAVATYAPSPGYVGSDAFAYSVHYGRAVASAAVDISVGAVNHAPVANDQAANATEDTSAAIVLQASDADGDSLTYSIVGSPQHGTLTGSGANLVYTPAPNYHGSDSFAFIANDGTATSNVATVTISVASVNDAPVAYGQALNGTEDNTLSVTLQATDADGDSLAYSIVAAPQHGTLSGSGAVRTYTPDANYHGPDSFSFTANDGAVASHVATVTITLASVNDAPVALADSVSTPRNTAVSITVLTNDTDIDGDALAIVSASNPAHGTAAISGTKVVYTPAKGYTGSDQFTYSITDGDGETASAGVTIAVTKK